MITVIVIGYNSMPYLKTCFDSVVSQTAIINEFIYIDNDSNDNSAEFVEYNYPQVRVVPANNNLGYSKAANLGIDLSESDYVLILNPDMILESSYLDHALTALKNNNKAAAVTGKIYKYDFKFKKKTKIIDTIGLVALKGRQILDNGAALEDVGQFKRPMEVFGVAGNCALFRKSALVDAKIGEEYFDEDFFMYKEDVDLCWRLRLLGWTFIYTPYAIAFHGRGTGVENRRTTKGLLKARKSLNAFQKYYSFKNHRLMLIKNELWTTFFRDFLSIIIRETLVLFWTIIFEPKNIKAFFEIIKQMRTILIKRKLIMRKIKISHKEIIPWLRGKGLII